MLTESAIEAFAIKLLERQGYTYVHGPALAPDSARAERGHYEIGRASCRERV